MGTLLNFGNTENPVELLFESINMDLQSLYDAQLLLESAIDLSDIETEDLVSITESSGVFGTIIDTIKRILVKIKEFFKQLFDKFGNSRIEKANNRIASNFEYTGRTFTVEEGISLGDKYITELEQFADKTLDELMVILNKSNSTEISIEYFTDKRPDVLVREWNEVNKEINLAFFNNEETSRKISGENKANIDKIFALHNSLNAYSSGLRHNQEIVERRLKGLISHIQKIEKTLTNQEKNDRPQLERVIKGVITLSISVAERTSAIARAQLSSLYEVGLKTETICRSYNMKVNLHNLEL